jgi:hypothetical protein
MIDFAAMFGARNHCFSIDDQHSTITDDSLVAAAKAIQSE